METWFVIVISLCISALIPSLINLLIPSTSSKKLPPGPYPLPIIGNLLCLRTSFAQLPTLLRSLRSEYGALITLKYGSCPVIFIADHSIAHQALIMKGAAFANRLPPFTLSGLGPNWLNIAAADYGSRWRHLRRNLVLGILSPSRVKAYSSARKRVLEVLINKLKSLSESGEAICVVDHLEDAIFRLLVLMCFGYGLDEEQISEINIVQRLALLNLKHLSVFNTWPRLWKILFRNRWNEILQICNRQKDLMIPLIRARTKRNGEENISYVDTLLDVLLPDENRKLDEEEIVSLCSEFFDAGKDTTASVLQWIMANLVKHPDIQAKLFEEINGVVESKQEVKEEDLQKMPYLKAVILEGLRCHPPLPLLVPHTTTKDVMLNGYVVPKNTMVNFMVADIGRDPKVWEDPMEFKPERFLSNNNGRKVLFDVTGSKEIKMMPFGAGRRVCPASGFALLHLEYFVANLVRFFDWIAVDGDGVDLSEKQKSVTVMKNPLRARISTRLT